MVVARENNRNIRKTIGQFSTLEEALVARNAYLATLGYVYKSI